MHIIERNAYGNRTYQVTDGNTVLCRCDSLSVAHAIVQALATQSAQVSK